jgi:hypothetical protein
MQQLHIGQRNDCTPCKLFLFTLIAGFRYSVDVRPDGSFASNTDKLRRQ